MAFVLALLILAFIFVEESTYKRWVVVVMPEGEFVKDEIVPVPEFEVLGDRKSWMKQFNLWNRGNCNHDMS